MQGQYAAPPVPGKMARRDHHRAQPAGPAAAAAGVRPSKAAVQDALKELRKEIDGGITKPGAGELHGPPVLRGLADRRAAGPGPEDGREEQVRPGAAAGGDRHCPAAGPGRHRRRQGAGRGRRDAEQLDGGDGAPGADPGDHQGAGQEPGAAERLRADRHPAGTAGEAEPQHDPGPGHRADRRRAERPGRGPTRT